MEGYMDIEKKMVKLLFKKHEIKEIDLYIYDDFEDDPDRISLQIDIEGIKYSGESDNHFEALIELRKGLERDEIKIMCNGAGKNVYPSPMQFNFGNTRKAYKKYLGEQARMSDLIDIFDYNEGIEFVIIGEQLEFERVWVNYI
jgi:hypothetical protein